MAPSFASLAVGLLVVVVPRSSARQLLRPVRGGSSEWRRPAEPVSRRGKSGAVVPSRASWQRAPRREAEAEEVFVLDDFLDRSSRVAFIRRVYGLLTASLGTSALACVACAANPGIVLGLLTQPAGQFLLGLAMLIGLVAPLALSLSPSLRHDPAKSLPIFAAFTLAESTLLGVASSAYKLQSVVTALAQTAAAVAGLTLYAYQPNPKYDLTGLGSGLFAALLVLLITAILGPILHIPNTLYSALGAVVFALFIVRDTELIVGGKHRRVQLDTRDYVLGAVTLYVDIANFFLFLLRLLDSSASNGDDSS